MKKIFRASLLFALSFTVLEAQQSIESVIVGEWTIDSVSDNKDQQLNFEENDDLKRIQKATLVFSADHHAKFHLPLSKYNVGNGYWYFDPKFDVIRITKWSDRKTDRIRLWYDIYDENRLKLYFDEKDFSFELYVSRKQ